MMVVNAAANALYAVVVIMVSTNISDGLCVCAMQTSHSAGTIAIFPAAGDHAPTP